MHSSPSSLDLPRRPHLGARDLAFTTAGVPAAQRHELWQSEITRFFGPGSTQFGPQEFNGRFSVRRAAGFGGASVRHNARGLTRTRHHLYQVDPDVVYLLLQMAGSTTVNHLDRITTLRVGDLVLVDAAQPTSFNFEGTNEQLCVQIPKAVLKDFHGDRPISMGVAQRGAAALVLGALLRPVFSDLEELTQGQSDAVRESVLRLLLATWGTGRPVDDIEVAHCGGAHAPLLKVIQTHIAGTLASPTLSPQSVAETFGISVRYVHRLFQEAGTTMGDYIRKSRLERCAADLRDPSLSSQSITKIAFGWGFNDAAHFSRCFRAELGCSPREYRNEQSVGSAHASSGYAA